MNKVVPTQLFIFRDLHYADIIANIFLIMVPQGFPMGKHGGITPQSGKVTIDLMFSKH